MQRVPFESWRVSIERAGRRWWRKSRQVRDTHRLGHDVTAKRNPGHRRGRLVNRRIVFAWTSAGRIHQAHAKLIRVAVAQRNVVEPKRREFLAKRGARLLGVVERGRVFVRDDQRGAVPLREKRRQPVATRGLIAIELHWMHLNGQLHTRVRILRCVDSHAVEHQRPARADAHQRSPGIGVRGPCIDAVAEHAHRRVEALALAVDFGNGRVRNELAILPGEDLFIVPAETNADVVDRRDAVGILGEQVLTDRLRAMHDLGEPVVVVAYLDEHLIVATQHRGGPGHRRIVEQHGELHRRKQLPSAPPVSGGMRAAYRERKLNCACAWAA